MRFTLRRGPRDVPCVEFVELVTAYLEGTLPPADVKALEHHLSLCDACGSYLEQMRQTIRLTGTLQVEDVPDEGVDDLMAMFRDFQSSRGDVPDEP